MRNPMNHAQIRRVELGPGAVDGIVFWSKNPAPLLPHLDCFASIPWYIQYTVTGYGPKVEPNVPDADHSRRVMREIHARYGPCRIVWRYDPIFFSDAHTLAWHVSNFGELCGLLSSCCRRVTVSFMDFYRKTRRNMAPLAPREPTCAEMRDLLARLAAIAAGHGLEFTLCAEDASLHGPGTGRARCVDAGFFAGSAAACQGMLPGVPLTGMVKRDSGQRELCLCHKSVDIGAYHTCGHGCLYCYASQSPAFARKNCQRHDPSGEFLL